MGSDIFDSPPEWPTDDSQRKKKSRPRTPPPAREVIPPRDDEPFNPPATPWVGDVWRGRSSKVVVDIVDVQPSGDTQLVTFEARPPMIRPLKRALKEFLREFEPRVLVEPRPQKGRE